MERYFVLKSGVIDNVILLDPKDAHLFPSAVRAGDIKGDIGWSWNNGNPIAPPEPVPTPEELRARLGPLTRRQLLIALFSIGITEEQVTTALSTDPLGLIEWKSASRFDRNHPLIADIADDFNLPVDQVDTLWGWALNL